MEASQLPLWVEYVKALGAPVVALAASFIAGAIAYRQWVTARNKLKLDLFDRRMEIYTAALDVINWMCTYSPDNEFHEVMRLRGVVNTAHWLLDVKAEKYLQDLMRRGYRAPEKIRPNFESMTPDERTEHLKKFTQEMRAWHVIEMQALDRVFDHHLKIKH